MAVVDSVKELLGLKEDDKKLDVIVSLTESRLKTILGVKEIPSELEYILVEVSIMRFNRIGSEGVTSHSVEGESMTFSNKDFNTFSDDINAWISRQKDQNKGKVRFL